MTDPSARVDHVELRGALREALVEGKIFAAEPEAPSVRLRNEAVLDLLEESVGAAAAFQRETRASEVLELRGTVAELAGDLDAERRARVEAEAQSKDLRERALDDQRRMGRLEDQLEQETARRRDLQFNERTNRVEEKIASESTLKQLNERASRHEQELRGLNRRFGDVILIEKIRTAALVAALTLAAILVPLYLEVVKGVIAFVALLPVGLVGLAGVVVVLGGRSKLAKIMTWSVAGAFAMKVVTWLVDYALRSRGSK